MKGSKTKELFVIALLQFLIVGIFFLTLRFRLGPLYEAVLIEPSGLLQQRPWMDFNGKEFKSGRFPLWNPYTGFGQPHLANLQTAVFYPLNLVPYLLGAKLGFELWLFLRLWLGGFFLYLFLRKLKLRLIPSLAGSLIWPLGGYGLWFMQLVELNSQILFPVFLMLFHNLAERARLKFFLLIIIIGALIILGGHPEAIFNSWLIGSLYFLFRLFPRDLSGKEKRERILLLIFGGALSALLVSLVLLPFINYYSRCWSLHYPGFGFFHLDIKTILSLVFPGWNFGARGPGQIAVELLGNGIKPVLKAGYLKTTVPGMIPGLGVVAIFLILLGLVTLKRAGSGFAFFALIMIFLLGLTYGIAPFKWLAFFPWFQSASNYKFYYSEIYFCFSVLTGLGLNRFFSRSKFWSLLIFILLALSLYLYSFTVKPYLDLGLRNLGEQEWLKEIQRDPEQKFFRVAVIGEKPALPPNLAMMYEINDIASSDALFPKDYVKEMMRLNGINQNGVLKYFYPAYYFRLREDILLKDNFTELVSEAGVRWIIGKNLSSRIINKQNISIQRYNKLEIISIELNHFQKKRDSFSRLKTITSQDFRLGLWVSLTSLIMIGMIWLLGRFNVKKS